MTRRAREAPITAAIVDDEAPARRKLHRLLAAHPDIQVVAEAADGASAVARLDACRPDVVFLDVSMPSMDGVEVVQRLSYDPIVVFTTAFDRYAVTAFTLHALDYLLKPFSQERFDLMIDRVREAVAHRAEDKPAVQARARRLADGATAPLRQLFVRVGARITPVPLDAVLWFEAQDDYVAVHEADRTHLASVRMSELEERLDPMTFRRVHRSAIVNLSMVERFQTLAEGKLVCVLRGGVRVPVSRSRARELRRETR